LTTNTGPRKTSKTSMDFSNERNARSEAPIVVNGDDRTDSNWTRSVSTRTSFGCQRGKENALASLASVGRPSKATSDTRTRIEPDLRKLTDAKSGFFETDGCNVKKYSERGAVDADDGARTNE
jgi:hypothetical protein